MDDMTNRALQASEIFSLYLAKETAKINASIKTAEEIAQNSSEIVNDFDKFQDRVNASLKLKEAFKKLQSLFLTNEKYAAKVDPLFVESVLLLKIDEG